MKTMTFVELQYRYKDALERAQGMRYYEDWANALNEAGVFKREMDLRQRRAERMRNQEEKYAWSKRKLTRTAS